MNVYKIKYKSFPEQEIEATNYELKEGFITFLVFDTNIFCINLSLVEHVRIDRRKVLSEEDKNEILEKYKRSNN